jgi:hypothetical protein
VRTQCGIDEYGFLLFQFQLRFLEFVIDESEGEFFLLVDVSKFEQVCDALAIISGGVVETGDVVAAHLLHLRLRV